MEEIRYEMDCKEISTKGCKLKRERNICELKVCSRLFAIKLKELVNY